MLFAATWMQLEIITLSEVSQKEKEVNQKVSQKDSIKASHTKWSKSERQIPYDIT